MRLLILFSIFVFLLGGCAYFNHRMGLIDDHIAEELLEELIESETGLDIDLTPGSLESS